MITLSRSLHCHGNTQFLPKHFQVRLALRISKTKFSQLQPVRHRCHGPSCETSSLSSVFHREGPCSIPDQSMGDLWWTKWYWDRSLYEYLFILSVSPVLQTHEFIHHRRYIILVNVFVKQHTKVSIFLIHISLFFSGV